MFYLPKKMLNADPVVSAQEQYRLVRALESFKEQISSYYEQEKKRGRKPKDPFESEAPTGDDITRAELDHLINILTDIETRKRPITRIAYNRALNILQQDIAHLPTLRNIFKTKGIVKDASAQIETILSSSGSTEINALVNYVRTPEAQVSASQLAAKQTPAPVEELFSNVLPEQILRNIFETFMPTGGGTQSGKGELALILLLKGATKPNKGGDVVVPEGKVEVKSNGRFGHGSNYGDAQPVFIKSFAPLFQNIPEFKNPENYWFNLNPKNLNIFEQMIETAIKANPGVNLREQIVKAYTDSIMVYFNGFNPEGITSAIQTAFDERGIPNREVLMTNLFKLSLQYYHDKVEPFTFLAVYEEGKLFFKTYEDALKSIDEQNGITYTDGPNFQDYPGRKGAGGRGSVFKIGLKSGDVIGGVF